MKESGWGEQIKGHSRGEQSRCFVWLLLCFILCLWYQLSFKGETSNCQDSLPLLPSCWTFCVLSVMSCFLLSSPCAFVFVFPPHVLFVYFFIMGDDLAQHLLLFILHTCSLFPSSPSVYLRLPPSPLFVSWSRIVLGFVLACFL